MTGRAYAVLDVFTDTPLQGNPVAVFTDGSGLDGETMQRTARELNLSETVFLLKPSDPDQADARVRIFTPTAELPFAGHPVLGAAFLLGRERGLGVVRLHTGAGLVPIRLDAGYGEMQQPIPAVQSFGRADELLAALGVKAAALPVETYTNGPTHVMVMLPEPAAVTALRPDPNQLHGLGKIAVSCFALSGPGQARTRMFAPALGVPEDPATGSAAGPLVVHLLRHGLIGPGERLEIHQGHQIGRPSVLYAEAHGSPEQIERVLVGGGAVVVARGEYRLE